MKRNDSEKDVDAYLAKLPADARDTLEAVREAIRAAAPEADEGISYGVPAFKFRGKALVCFAAFKNHFGFYPLSPDVLSSFAEDLAAYETAKGTIRFTAKKSLPKALVIKIVKARLKELGG